MLTTPMPASRCPVCAHRFDAATCIEADALPRPGDATICIACAALLIFTEALEVRPVMRADLARFSIESLGEIQAVRRFIMARNVRNGEPLAR